MKKNLIYLTSLAIVALAFISCEEGYNNGDDNGLIVGGTITATVENGTSYNSQIDSVYAWIEWSTGESEWKEEIIAKAPYQNGGFTITLPETVSDECLSTFGTSGAPKITVSDATAKFIMVEEFISIKNGNRIGYIEKSSISENDLYSITTDKLIEISANGIYNVMYIYVNKPVTISGSNEYDEWFNSEKGTRTENYNLSLLKGWNVYVAKATLTRDPATQKVKETVLISNSEPAGLKWYYYSFGAYFSPKKLSIFNN
jgi:hypothetical protein